MSEFKPEDYDIPADYRHWEGDSAEDYIGPFFFYMEDGHPRTALRLGAQHCNAHNSVHGGVLMTFADYTLCLGANGGSSDSVVTVTQNNDFIAPAHSGDLVHGNGEVLRRGKSMVFMRCTLRVEDRIVMVSSAVIKRLPRAG